MSATHRYLESTLLGIAFALLWFGVPDEVPLGFKDMAALAAIGLLFSWRA